MSSQEVFYILGSIGFVILSGSLIYIAIRLRTTLQKVDYILNEVKGVTDEIEIFKQGIKMGLVTLISGLVGKLTSKPTKEVKVNE